MTRLPRLTLMRIIVLLCFACATTIHASDWTEAVEVRQDSKRCVSYRAKLDGPFLVIQATLDPGWHTFAMDNKQRALEKLAGRRSLGIDRPTEIILTEGLELAGPWHQSAPKDFSKPELRWFSWGFDGQALFVAKVRRSKAESARIAVRGQACTETTCKNIETEISMPLADVHAEAGPSSIDLKTLVQVR
jgi:DsbC/DsbD-like thiol-disulfide interchange protein